MLKVCHLISGDLWAGAEVMAYNLLHGLQAFPELEISVIILNNKRLAQELKKLKVAVYVFDEEQYSFFYLAIEIRALLHQLSPQILHSHRYKENMLAFFGRKLCTKLVATQHGMPEVGQRNITVASSLIARANRYLLTKRFNRVVGVSNNIRDFFQECGTQSDRFQVIHNGIKLPGTIPRRGYSKAIGSAGRLYPVKDFPLMVHIAKMVAEKGYQMAFKIAGDGPERSKVEELINTHHLCESFSLLGNIAEMGSFTRV